MVLKITGLASAICTQRVLTLLHEKDITDFEIIPISLADMKGPAYLKLHPFGKIPVLDDDGYILYESRAICKYLAKKYAGQGTKLLPADEDLKGYGLFEKACSLESSYFNHPASEIADLKLFKPAYGAGQPDEVVVAKQVADLEKVLIVYDGILATQQYLAGDELTLADLFHLSYGTVVKDLGYSDIFDKLPNVKRWFDSLQERESWKKVPSTVKFIEGLSGKH
ncbi:Glutathione S-transferase hmp2 [Lachnellula suecica]|uniref:glutathione transferase n=1 Tax=Lachnellula suecica TaxID=602035 RepID=A0A8T9C989_9HELO|nr:Glutathione S-transferase hmp2 [Lachnellula suecica]